MLRRSGNGARHLGQRLVGLVPSILAAAAPGLSRFLLVAGLAAIYGMDAAGPVSNDLAIMYFAGFVTATGWATTLLTMGAAHGPGARNSLVAHILGAFVTTVLCVPLVGFLDLAVIGPVQLIFLLFGYAIYQCVRSFLAASANLLHAASLDFFAHLPPLGVAWLCVRMQRDDAEFMFATLGASLAVLPLFLLPRAGGPRRNVQEALSVAAIRGALSTAGRHAIRVGLAMLVSSGALFTFVPLVFLVGEPSEATIAALIVNLLAASSLLPRAVTLHHLPAISKKLVADPDHVHELFRRFQSASVRVALIVAAVTLVLLCLVARLLSGDTLFLVVCLAAGTVAPLFASAEIHLMIAKGRSSQVLWMNAAWSLPYFVGLVFAGRQTDPLGAAAVIGLGSAYVLGNLARTVAFWRAVRTEIAVRKVRD